MQVEIARILCRLMTLNGLLFSRFLLAELALP